ncbi:hypothetical protein LX70_02687 [Defluviimonas denitrificans]|jgi:hypothetical protein|uniref:Glycosyl hydrolase family 16 n=1 Tax=Albidovulum denitrificans TaxID=404881 RepID=A0A2S8S6H9_9RHOB|nr:hypothetical protein [Defluviimonas denitrificans]PQV56421.1 hypothetical protein LX70_02687 [Defluviimonas denitrificans]
MLFPRPHIAAAGGTPSFTTHGTYFYGTNTGTNNGQVTFKGRLLYPAYPSGGETIFSISGLQVRQEIMPDGSVRSTLKDNAGATLLNNAQSVAGVIPAATMVDWLLSIDLAAGYMRTFIDGSLVDDRSFTSVPQTFQTNRQFSFLCANSTALGTPASLVIEHLKVWKDTAAPTGVEPVTTPLKTIAGNAAAANADAWKLGGDAT